jgi:hypothetical protein
MEIVNLGNIIVFVLLGLLAFIFKNERSSLKEQITTNRADFNKAISDLKKIQDKENEEIKRRHDLLEAKFYEFENEKYTKIMDVLSGIKADIAVIKNEIDNLKAK